jgi:hypothetical protein
MRGTTLQRQRRPINPAARLGDPAGERQSAVQTGRCRACVGPAGRWRRRRAFAAVSAKPTVDPSGSLGSSVIVVVGALVSDGA